MSCAHYATISFLVPFTNPKTKLRKPLVLSSLSNPSPSKPTKRKNYLRPKLLKTLTKPYPTTLFPQEQEPPSNPIILIGSPLEQQPESPSDQSLVDEELNLDQYEEIAKAPEAVRILDDSARDFTTGSVLRFGLFLVGAFVFQTICAVWVFGSANSDHKDGDLGSEDKSRVLELGRNEDNVAKSKFLLNGSSNLLRGNLGFKQGGILYVDESELEEKIVEIQAMARDARRREKLESVKNGLNDDYDDVFKNGIGKEVGNRLVKLQKRLENNREKLPKSFDSYLNKNGKIENEVDKDSSIVKEANEALMFKKKHKFRSSSTKPSNKPKGFLGSEDTSVTKTENRSPSDSEDQMVGNGSAVNNGLDSLDKEQQLDLSNGQLKVSDSMVLEEDAGRKSSAEDSNSLQKPRKKLGKVKGRKKSGRKVGAHSSDSRTGVAQDISPGRPLLEAMGSMKSSKFSQSFAKESEGTTAISNKHDTHTELWWLGFPYVLAILMQSGHDGEGPQGLFTLKTASETQDKGDSSHTIAYEDRGDVTNFCYLLHSFFEDLEDFSAEILPFPTKFVGLKLSDNICLNPEVASSDQESIEELYAEVINSSTEKNFDNYQIDLATESPPRTHDLLNGGALQLAVEDDTINNGNDVISAGKSYITATDLVKEGKIKPTTREHRKNETSISYEVVKGHFGMKLEDAAEKLDVSRSTLKRLCRQNGVPRWPSHKRKKVNHPLSNQDPSSSNPPTDQAIQDGRIATIKAEYGDDIIKFKLSFSSRMRDLEEEVGKRLKLENGTFKIKYVDGDGDRILIACDADLNDCIHFLTSSGITTIKMFVELGALS